MSTLKQSHARHVTCNCTMRSAHCNPCPVRSSCTSGTNPRNVCCLPRHLHELQQQNCADQHDPGWKRRCTARSGSEDTIDEIVNGSPDAALPLPRHRQGPQPARLHGHRDHHRTPGRPRAEAHTYRSGPPTGLQQYIEAHELPRPRWWRQGA
ncbi:transposase [Streptomyces cadmiisoli]|uniref:transposase n=1 Tax=Streptomyces cadmiisoli TaxID=2184053 RepID=UPI00365FE261